MIMVATGALQMLWTGGTRMLTGSGPECAVLRAVSGNTVRIHCHKTGFARARLVGVEVPDFFAPACREEWFAGIEAWWFLQLELSRTRIKRIRLQDDKDTAILEAHLFLNGENAARKIIREGHGRVPGRTFANHWCE